MSLEKLKKHAEQFPPNHCCFSPEDVLPLISEIERLQAAFDKVRTDAHTAQFELAEVRAKNLKGCDLFIAPRLPQFFTTLCIVLILYTICTVATAHQG